MNQIVNQINYGLIKEKMHDSPVRKWLNDKDMRGL